MENYTKIPHRIPITIEYEMSTEEQALYELIEKYLNRDNKLALNVLKIFNTGQKSLSLSKKRFKIGANPVKYLAAILCL